MRLTRLIRLMAPGRPRAVSRPRFGGGAPGYLATPRAGVPPPTSFPPVVLLTPSRPSFAAPGPGRAAGLSPALSQGLGIN
jgi:hypothetical protein